MVLNSLACIWEATGETNTNLLLEVASLLQSGLKSEVEALFRKTLGNKPDESEEGRGRLRSTFRGI